MLLLCLLALGQVVLLWWLRRVVVLDGIVVRDAGLLGRLRWLLLLLLLLLRWWRRWRGRDAQVRADDIILVVLVGIVEHGARGLRVVFLVW